MRQNSFAVFLNLKMLTREIGHPFLKFAKNFTSVSYIPVSYKPILSVAAPSCFT